MASLMPADSVADRPTLDPTLNDVAKRVHEKFDDHLGSSAVDECLNQIAARFEGAKIRSFIPLLVRRYVREELQARVSQGWPYPGHIERSASPRALQTNCVSEMLLPSGSVNQATLSPPGVVQIPSGS